jgi:hypothetical protein
MLEVSYNKHKLDSHLVIFPQSSRLYKLGVILNKPTHFSNAIFVVKFYENICLRLVVLSGVCISALMLAVVESPELIWLKWANHHHRGDRANPHLKRSKTIVCRVTS